MVTGAIKAVNDPLHLKGIVGSDKLMQVLHEDGEDLRIRVRLRARVVYSPSGVDSTDQVHFWHELLDWDAIGVVAATPLPPGEAHVGQPALINGNQNSFIRHLLKDYFSALLPENEAALRVAFPANSLYFSVPETQVLFNYLSNEVITQTFIYRLTDMTLELINIPQVATIA
jgi:hypothetical protein